MGIADSLLEKIALEKAIIEVIDVRPSGDTVKKVTLSNPNSTGQVDTEITNRQVAVQTLKAQDKLKQAAYGNALAAAGAELATDDDIEKVFTQSFGIVGAKKRRFKVQFNPSSINISGYGGGLSKKTVYSSSTGSNNNQSGASNARGGLTYSSADPHIEFSVQLIFDNTNNLKAFPGDIAGLNFSKGLNAAGNAMKNTKVGEKLGMARPSVREEVDAFIGALRNKYTRSVTFVWGRMMYSGIVNNVGSKYTLFNPSGEPIRATVSFRMTCADPSVAKGQLGYWGDFYKEFFNGDMSFKTYSNSFLNFNG